MVSIDDINLLNPFLQLKMNTKELEKGNVEVLLTWVLYKELEGRSFIVEKEVLEVKEAREFLIDTWIQLMFPRLHSLVTIKE